MKDWKGNEKSTFVQLGASNHTKKDEREYTQRERILFKNGKDTMRIILKYYFKKVEQKMFTDNTANYVIEKIILSAKQDRPKLLQQTYSEYEEEGKSIVHIKNVDRIMYCCPKTLQDTTEALKLIYEHASEYYEKSAKEET